MSFLFELIWSQTIVAYFQNWPYYNGDWEPYWLMFFVLTPLLSWMLPVFFLVFWSDQHSKKYPVDKDAEPEKELPRVPEGLFALSIKEDSWFIKSYLEEFKRYPRSLCDYAPYCAGYAAVFGFGGLAVFGLLVFASNVLFYWLWVGLWKVLLATPRILTEIIPLVFFEFVPWIAMSLFAGATSAVSYAAGSSIATRVGVFMAVFGLTILFLRSQAGLATRLWMYSKAKNMCIPLRIVPAKKLN